ncbi:MAG TPA: T9SS type A sorting domain-containing protein [Ignavibacteria bacterium]|nr:T9SS type A sorting domain-containing protein [Ignavibacteria bacterium]
MKTKTIVILMLISLSTYSQFNPHDVNCLDNQLFYYCYDNSYLGGQCKPESIDRYTTDLDAVFRVLTVYVQLQNDPFPDAPHWMRGQQPEYFGKLLSPVKINNPNWWDAYSEQDARMSDYWMEVSRGKFHVTGQEVNIILDHDNAWYISNGGGAAAMDELYGKLAAMGSEIDWPSYDQWSKNGTSFRYGSPYDGYVDMIYFIWRSKGTVLGDPSASFTSCNHGSGHVIYNLTRDIKILPAGNEFGSGFQISGAFGNPLEKWSAVSFIPAEHGHYTLGISNINGGWFGGHQNYGKVNNYFGYEEFYSPYELIRLGYFQTKKINYSITSSYSLDDWTTRNNKSYADADEILEVPIGDANRNEFFLIVNRQKVSTYDKIMWGDTAHDNPYRNINPDYGKGVYIYHAYPGAIGQGYQWQIPFDQECADGLYNWVQDGYQLPDWSIEQYIPYLKKSTVVYDMNDDGGTDNSQQSLNNHDGKSLGYYERGVWFGLGKKHPALYTDGTDRIWTNRTQNFNCNPDNIYEVWTSRELQGDRWDAWNVGYNQVFSPYSSPSTYNWSNQNSEIFIYLESQNGTQANFKIYKSGEGGLTEDDILAITPPSKPMGLVADYYYVIESGNEIAKPKLTWNHNQEPDMLRADGKKRYKVYKAIADDMGKYPVTYLEISTVDVLNSSQPEFIDNNTAGECSLFEDWGQYVWHPARYKIQAVDKYETGSVLSDFAAFVVLRIINGGGGELDNMFGQFPEIPERFNLFQNYPNPFNPSTEIKYALPQNDVVTIKVYNITGELAATLVDKEHKNAGYYTVTFDGTALSSGVYFYKIETSRFNESKKMVLIK